MKSKQFLGNDMRDALRQIRLELGPDAVILSTRRLGTGVEVSAAVDPKLMIRGALPASAAAAREPHAPLAAAATIAAAPGESPAALMVAHEQQAMSEELRTLRQLLERQLAALAWNDYTRREPLRAGVLTELTALGLTRDVALAILEELPTQLSSEQAQHLHRQLLARRIATAASPLTDGGAWALIGASGSGRSSLLTKLAVRWLAGHESASLAIVSIDDERFGAAAQTRALAAVLDVACFCCADATAVGAVAQRLAGFGCVLIDTPGLGTGATAAASALREALPGVRSLLTLPASTQGEVLEATLRRAAAFAPACCALTRCDEAVSLGAVLSTLIRARLPVALLSNGPGVPEDLQVARAEELVAMATQLARRAPGNTDQELLAQRYGGMIHAAA